METEISTQAVGLASSADFSLINLFLKADIIVKSVIIILILCSIYSWAVIFEKFKLFKSINNSSDQFEEKFWKSRSAESFYNSLPQNLNDPMAYTQKIVELEEAIRAAGHDMNIGVFQPLGGGTEVFHVRAVSQTAGDLGKVIDEYYAGGSWAAIWNESAQYVDEIVSDTIEHCQIIYTK